MIGPSGNDPTQHEQFKILGIDQNQITLDGTLAFDHFGNPQPTITTSFGVLDMRDAVGLLTRNIKIRGNDDNGN